MTFTGMASTGPILVVGEASGTRRCIHDILVAAGYDVVMASEPGQSLRVATASRPRLVAVAVDGEGDWDRFAHPLLESGRTVPVVPIEVGARSCRAPSFARQLLEEIQYLERPRFTSRRAATR